MFAVAKKKKKKLQKGFTLLELLIVIALMGIIYSVTLSDYAGLNKSVELQNTVYNVALSIREAQVYGINKKLKDTSLLEAGEDGFTDKNPYIYGIYIDTDKKNEIVLFRDKGVNPKKFEGNCDTNIIECEKKIVLNQGNYISNIRVNNNGSWSDYEGKINVMFKRPNPDAIIVDNNNAMSTFSRIGLQISSKNDIYRGCVKIGSAGDISLEKGYCD